MWWSRWSRWSGYAGVGDYGVNLDYAAILVVLVQSHLGKENRLMYHQEPTYGPF
jgi:hypothetical protein